MSDSSDAPPVRRALLSVYDKSGITDFARRLVNLDVDLVSTGGTAQVLRDAGLPVTEVADVTGVPEVLEGRVKSLHPSIHAALLARRSNPDDMAALEERGDAPIDLVVCNLYPFEEVVQDPDTNRETAMATVDIGGPTMVRAAAKNHASVGVVTAPDTYDAVATELEENDGRLSEPTRRTLATEAFAHTATYDRAIHGYLSGADDEATKEGEDKSALPNPYRTSLPLAQQLRYGENPHQDGALYGHPGRFFDQIHGADLSYNNLLDLTGAISLIDEFRDADPTCAILKHTNPCGVATADTLETAWERAFATDTQSPYGGIVVVNEALDRPTAETIDEIFTEIVIAPAFESGVVEFLAQNDRRRVIKHVAAARKTDRLDVRSVLGGLLVQTRDPALPPQQAEGWTVATERAPTDDEKADLDFAWRVVKHVKSNAIVYARDRATLGVGAGQMSRIDASELAVRKATKSELDLTGSVVASDAFFPFADGLEAAAAEGAWAAIQPGGSIRDEEVIEAADAHNMAMVFTGHRHFRH